MVFSKSFPRTIEKSTYPIWEEVYLTKEEEEEIEKESKRESIQLMNEAIEDAKKIVSKKKLKVYQSDIINMAISLFEKRAPHVVHNKEKKTKDKFDEKYRLK